MAETTARVKGEEVMVEVAAEVETEREEVRMRRDSRCRGKGIGYVKGESIAGRD